MDGDDEDKDATDKDAEDKDATEDAATLVKQTEEEKNANNEGEQGEQHGDGSDH